MKGTERKENKCQLYFALCYLFLSTFVRPSVRYEPVETPVYVWLFEIEIALEVSGRKEDTGFPFGRGGKLTGVKKSRGNVEETSR